MSLRKAAVPAAICVAGAVALASAQTTPAPADPPARCYYTMGAPYIRHDVVNDYVRVTIHFKCDNPTIVDAMRMGGDLRFKAKGGFRYVDTHDAHRDKTRKDVVFPDRVNLTLEAWCKTDKPTAWRANSHMARTQWHSTIETSSPMLTTDWAVKVQFGPTRTLPCGPGDQKSHGRRPSTPPDTTNAPGPGPSLPAPAPPSAGGKSGVPIAGS